LIEVEVGLLLGGGEGEGTGDGVVVVTGVVACARGGVAKSSYTRSCSARGPGLPRSSASGNGTGQTVSLFDSLNCIAALRRCASTKAPSISRNALSAAAFSIICVYG
jgi:hypothetical protein